MMAREPDHEIEINASEANRKVVEIDAKVIAKIIMRRAHAREVGAAKAANSILDYIAECMRGATSIGRTQ